MPRLCNFVPILLLFPSPVFGQPAPTHRIEIADHQVIQASIGYEICTVNSTVTRWTAFLPEPPELPSQTRIKTTADPAGKLIVEKSALARKLRMFDVPIAQPVPGAKLVLRYDIQATLRSRKLIAMKPEEKPPTVAVLTAAERKFYLASSKRIDFDKNDFKVWLEAKKLRRAKSESALDFANRVLQVIRTDYEYKYDRADERRASASCSQPFSDCGGMSFIFVAAMRANDVPSRVLIGRFALPRKADSNPADNEYDQPHVRAEMYVAGIGWVCVDPACIHRDKHRPIADLIGLDPGDMLVLHVDLDLRLPVPDKEQTVDLLQIEPYVWTQGRGRSDVTLGPTKWEVKATILNEKK